MTLLPLWKSPDKQKIQSNAGIKKGVSTYAVVVEGDGVGEPVEGRSRWDQGWSLRGVCSIPFKRWLFRRICRHFCSVRCGVWF